MIKVKVHSVAVVICMGKYWENPKSILRDNIDYLGMCVCLHSALDSNTVIQCSLQLLLLIVYT